MHVYPYTLKLTVSLDFTIAIGPSLLSVFTFISTDILEDFVSSSRSSGKVRYPEPLSESGTWKQVNRSRNRCSLTPSFSCN